MRKYNIAFILFLFVFMFSASVLLAQNPFIRDQFTADPTARVFNGKVYVYPSHDILAVEGKGRPGWFCMEDYHVFSSSNLTDWTDHGVIVSQNKVEWVDSTSYSMWAPDCIEKDGKYYFYFPTSPKGKGMRRGFRIGVAVAEKPEGPYVPQPEPIKNLNGIDPNVLIDKDGQAYLYWSMGNIFVAKLADDLLELASEPQVIEDLPKKGLKEGPYVFERNGIYYMTYPHVENKTERLEYAIGDNPMGPFKVTGVIMDEHPNGCWTNHHSVIEFEDQWYLFYHQNDLSPKFDKNRSIKIDSLFFNEDGTIQKVIPTLRGVGITNAVDTIQIDRYSLISDQGAGIAFIDTTHTFAGWKAELQSKDAWVQYNNVAFNDGLNSVLMKIRSNANSTVLVRLDSADGPLLAKVKIPGKGEWMETRARIKNFNPGIHNVVVLLDGDPVEIDWLKFE